MANDVKTQGQTTVTTGAAVELMVRNTKRRLVTIQNVGDTNNVVVRFDEQGDTTVVTASNGLVIKPGNNLTYAGDGTPAGRAQAIAVGGDTTVAVLETSA